MRETLLGSRSQKCSFERSDLEGFGFLVKKNLAGRDGYVQGYR